MACITAPIAAKPAISTLPMPMTTDSVTIECEVQNDRRLLVGLGAIFSHSAEHAGLSEPSQEEFAAAALDACREAFALAKRKGHPDSALEIVIGEFTDRVEVAIEYPGDLIAAARSGKAPGKEAIDFVKVESSEGRSRVKLIKYAGVAKPK
jgi:hypothetical protein